MQPNPNDDNAICALNLPPGDVRLRHTARGNEIYDPLRKKWLLLTQEEWVRQHFTTYMQTRLSYPASLMANEIAIKLNNTTKRCDTVVYDRNGQPILIVEYKAPSIPLTQDVFNQIARYSIALRVKYLVVSNGLRHYCCALDTETRRYRFLQAIPSYNELSD